MTYLRAPIFLLFLSLVLVLGVLSVVRGQTGNSSPAPIINVPFPFWVSATSESNTEVMATLPAATGRFQYITVLHISVSCLVDIVGDQALEVTTTNLPGDSQFIFGDSCKAGEMRQVVNFIFPNPLKVLQANTDTTFTCPAVGPKEYCQINVGYYLQSPNMAP